MDIIKQIIEIEGGEFTVKNAESKLAKTDLKAFEKANPIEQSAKRDQTARNWCDYADDLGEQEIRQACSSRENSIGGLVTGNASDKCTPVDVPRLYPALTLRWGDSPKDQIETNDAESMCLVARNPYSNITFTDFKIKLSYLFGPNGYPAQNPDGSLSSKMTPAHQICFDDLGPCQSVSRELMLLNRNAMPGKWYWVVYFCANYTVQQNLQYDVFPMDYELS